MKAHGEHHLKLIEQNIIQMKFIGAFNEQGAKVAFKALRQLIKKLNNNHFLLLSDYEQLEGATPEAYKEVHINNQWLSGQNIIAKAIIFSSETVQSIGFKNVPQEGLNSKVFKNKSSAMHWLQQQLPQ